MTYHLATTTVFVVYEPANFSVGLDIARHFRNAPDHRVLLWCPYWLPETASYIEMARQNGSTYIYETTVYGGNADMEPQIEPYVQKRPDYATQPLKESARLSARLFLSSIKSMHQLSLVEFDAQAVVEIKKTIRRKAAMLDDIIWRLHINCVLLGEDNIERDSSLWIDRIHVAGGQAIIVSYGALSESEAVNAYFGSSTHKLPSRTAAALRLFMPEWVRTGDEGPISRIPLPELLAREDLDLTMWNPWLVNAGRADMIGVESNAIRDRYLNFGFPASQVRVLGHPVFVTLAAASDTRASRRTALRLELAKPEDGLLILCAFPPNQFGTRQTADFNDFPSLVLAWVSALAKVPGATVIYSPHPNLSQNDVALIEQAGGTVRRDNLPELLPLCDLYVTSVSSTIKWALACAIPILNYDCYRYGYDDYHELPQVTECADVHSFNAGLSRLTEPGQLERITKIAAQDSHRWGTIDYDFMVRLGALLTSPASQGIRVADGIVAGATN